MAKKSKYLKDTDLHKMLEPYVQKVVRDIGKINHSAIQQYYQDYTPGTYVKSDNPKDIYERVFGMNKLYTSRIDKTNTGYDITFTFSSDNMTIKDNRNNEENNEEAFRHSFLGGWHGGSKYYGNIKAFVPSMTPSPYDIIYSFVENYNINKRY